MMPRPGPLGELMRSFDLELRYLGRSELTRDQYLMSVGQFIDWCAGARARPLDPADATSESVAMPILPTDVTAQHIKMFLADFATMHKPATVQTRYKCLRIFFDHLVDEGEITSSPMQQMSPPSVPPTRVAVFTKEELAALLKTADGRDYDSVRDRAILLVFMDSGVRRGEIASLKKEDIDWRLDVITVTGKGSRERSCPFGIHTAKALTRYLRLRDRRADAALPWLWLGKKGRLSDSGIYQMVCRRGEEAGLGKIHPHQLRHSFSHHYRLDGGNDSDLMVLAGWSSPQMLRRYGASAADVRAREAHRRLSLGDQL